MSETSGFFEAEYNESTGEYDREYFASQFANYFKLFFKNGVFGTPTNQLKVIAGEGLNVIVKEGWAFIDGYWYYNDEDLILPITPNTTAFARNDSIMCRLDIATRTINTLAFANTTDVVRDGSYYDLQLATLSLGVAATSISDSNIDDKRTDENVCGLVTGVLKVETTSDLFAQFNSQFKEWFDEIKGQLDEDAAGHLQQQIGLLSNLETQTKEDLVSAVNEVNKESVKYDDIVNDLETALAVTEDGVPVGCGVVKELNDSLASALITNSYSSATFYNVISKRAGIVTINANLISSTYTVPVGVVIATIPDGFKPRNHIYRVPCALRNPASGGLSLGYINIYTDGRIIIDGVTAIPDGTREVDINITYVCAT